MGVVFLARQTKLDRWVAVKMLSPGKVDGSQTVHRLEDEALTLANLSHPNIVGCHDIVRHGDSLFVVMDYVPGQLNVLDACSRYGKLPEEHAVRIILQAARGLAYCHSKGIIHRDIKPGNLLVFYDGDSLPDSISELLDHEHTRIMIVDFGLAKSRPRGGSLEEPEDRIMGTPAFMAPEQAAGKDVDHRADIYGLGATLFRLLTGHEPFEADTPLEAIQLKLTTGFPDASEHGVRISSECRRAIDRMIANQAEQRYQNYSDLIRDLEALADRTAIGHVRRSIRRALRPRVWVSAVAAVLLLCLVVGLLLRGNQADLELSSSLRHWSGSTTGWTIAPPDDAVEGELALVCNSPGERLTLDRPIRAGSDVTFLMRLPGNGQLDVLLTDGSQSMWMLRWTRGRNANQLQAGPVDRQSDLSLGPVKAPPEWYTVRLRTSPRQVVVFLDESLAGYGQFESPVDHLTLAFELSQGQVMQVKKLRIIPPDGQ
jgi:serine/threonine-protein kinase